MVHIDIFRLSILNNFSLPSGVTTLSSSPFLRMNIFRLHLYYYIFILLTSTTLPKKVFIFSLNSMIFEFRKSTSDLLTLITLDNISTIQSFKLFACCKSNFEISFNKFGRTSCFQFFLNLDEHVRAEPLNSSICSKDIDL